MSYVGKQFPDITVNAINSTGEALRINLLDEAIDNKKKILLFWYPKDFTYVCPTELHAFQAKLKEFESKNTMVIGASCDTAEVHFAWLSTPKNRGGIEGITYPLIADSNRNLASFLDILDAEEEYDENVDDYIYEGDMVTYRATYLIDEEGKVFHESINDMPIGRNVDEYLRLIDAYTHVQEHGEVCPANWQEGSDAMTASAEGTADYLQKH